jgi:hypothetical protein
MSYYSVDIEADGQIPGDFSMICFGMVLIDKEQKLDKTFYGELKPISDKWIPEALEISGFTREETLRFKDPVLTLQESAEWIRSTTKGQPMFISDNNGFDWSFINWYYHHFLNYNPFGHSSMNLGSLYKGVVLSCFDNFKHLRKTKHTHNPVDDAKGNAEALLAIIEKYKLKIRL